MLTLKGNEWGRLVVEGKMNKEEYRRAAEALSACPPDTNHPEGQKFRIGDVVQIVNPQSWFAKRAVRQIFIVNYSYYQKFKSMCLYYPELSMKRYSLTHVESGVTSAWYDEDELGLYNEWPDEIEG